jgi:hypothetical protein
LGKLHIGDKLGIEANSIVETLNVGCTTFRVGALILCDGTFSINNNNVCAEEHSTEENKKERKELAEHRLRPCGDR